MALYFRKKTLLAKIESTYGTDPTPTGAANAILTKNLQIQLMQGNTVNRDVDRPTLGNDLTYHVAPYTKLSFDVELAGSGTAGTAPAYAPLLKACGFAETVIAAPVTGTAQAGASGSITLAAGASAVDNFYCGTKISLTDGTGSGQTNYITDYNGTTKIATMLSAWSTSPDATSEYSIGAAVVYAPISASFPSLTCYFNLDGEQHELNGVRGAVKLALSPGALPMLNFELTGLRVAPTASAAPTCDWSGFKIPVTVNAANASAFTLHGYAATVSKLDLDLANQVTYRNVIGQETVELTDRAPSGSITFDMPAIGTKDFHDIIADHGTGAVHFVLGSTAGSIIQVLVPQAQLLQPQITDADGIASLQCGMRLIPTDAGNDELFLTIR